VLIVLAGLATVIATGCGSSGYSDPVPNLNVRLGPSNGLSQCIVSNRHGAAVEYSSQSYDVNPICTAFANARLGWQEGIPAWAVASSTTESCHGALDGVSVGVAQKRGGNAAPVCSGLANAGAKLVPGQSVQNGQTTAFAGEYLHIDAQRQPELMRALAAAGHEGHQADDDLVSRACGAWRYS
jgi:hypothetical protein